ncbi:MAG: hypothetical protein D6814_14965 [Calditrichaeota bacterium]|nr:MAG: hypothetical protein D6814_14965 [Calditrichota bacterium]
MVNDPAATPQKTCDPCHGSIGSQHLQSLHANLQGYKTMLLARTGQAELSPELTEMFQTKCTGCHTTCGQCHISRPKSTGGGFNAGHMFLKRPSMTLNCTACHGSRIGEEYRGTHPGIEADVHYNKGMQCVACHTASEVHNASPTAKSRYEAEQLPRCEDCHTIGTENSYHAIHRDKLSCQVCHSQPYKNCYNCHVGKTESGLRQPSELDFKIGRNPMKSARRPYDFVVLRHVPVAPDSYEEWAPGQMTNFAALPTWKFATPHNIQKNTPQTKDCTSSCHNNPAIFLTPKDLEKLPAEEQEANKNVVVTKIPD